MDQLCLTQDKSLNVHELVKENIGLHTLCDYESVVDDSWEISHASEELHKKDDFEKHLTEYDLANPVDTVTTVISLN